MARSRSDDKRTAILSAAIRQTASQGRVAATAPIAKDAGVSNGSLFTYFEMGAAALDGLPKDADLRDQLLHMWSHWLSWATSCPDKRRTLAHLAVSDEITSETRQTASRGVVGIAKLLERSRENGPMRDVPLGFVVALMSALAESTMDFMIRAPANADKHCRAAFDAAWRMVT